MKVTLIAKTSPITEHFPKADRPWYSPSGLERIVCSTGKNCTGKFDDKLGVDEIDKFNHLNVNKLKHDSLLEHYQFTFRIEGISRACSHQLVRHRHLSFSQTSQRCISVLGSENPLFDVVIPEKFKDNEEAMVIFAGALAACKEAYYELRELGFKKEDCRSISPQCHKTDIIVSGNARALKDFFRLRLWGKGVQNEIKVLATKMYNIVESYGNFFDEKYS